MAGAKLIKTRTPGIYRRGSKYVVVYWVDGRQRRESAATMDAARRLKSARLADRNRGDLFESSSERFADYASEWVERYQGIRESTRENYRRDIDRYAIPFLGQKELGSITGRDLAEMVAWLLDERRQAKHHNRLRVEAGKKPSAATTRHLSDSTIANAMKSVRACRDRRGRAPNPFRPLRWIEAPQARRNRSGRRGWGGGPGLYADPARNRS